MNKPSRNLSTIAKEIQADWTNVYFGAKPYLAAMHGLKGINDRYGYDSARSVVLYFLSNASTWKGPVARSIKKELRDLTK